VLVFNFLAIINALAQDLVIYKDGKSIEGVVEIKHSLRGDLVIVGGKEVRANQINEIRMEDGSSFYTRPVIYYSEKDNAELDKVAILGVKLKGSVDLYTYEGEGFDYAISNGSGTRVLQDLPINANSQNIFAYKIELINALGGCLDAERIFESSLTLNRMIYLVNLYNKCEDELYEPQTVAHKKKKIRRVGLALGTNIEGISYKDVVVTKGRQKGSIDISEKKGSNFEMSGFIKKNFGESETFFWEAGLSIRVYKFQIDSAGVSSISVKNNIFSEIDLSFGVVYQKKLFDPVSIDLATGSYLWVLAPPTIEYIIPNSPGDNKAGYYSTFDKAIGAGAFLSTDLHYTLGKGKSLFLGAKKHFLGSESTNGTRDQGSFVLRAGLSIKLVKEGVF
jgi:hypothetical protein